MPPRGQHERHWDRSDIERTEEYKQFMATLEEHHQSRGTMQFFLREPGFGHRRLDLLKLYKRVIDLGGYDKVSAITSLWRNLATEYKVQEMSNSGYLLKNIYYKNLASFEIIQHWHKEPPPPSMMEELTARGGDILQRTEEWRLIRERPPSPPRPRKLVVRAKSADDDGSGSGDGDGPKAARPSLRPDLLTFYAPAKRRAESDGPDPDAKLLRVQLPPSQSGAYFAPVTLTSGTAAPLARATPAVASLQRPDRTAAAYRLGAGSTGAPFFLRLELALKSRDLDEMQWAINGLFHQLRNNNDFELERAPILTEALLRTVTTFVDGLRPQIETTPDYLVLPSTSELDVATTAALLIRNLVAESQLNSAYLTQLQAFKEFAEAAVLMNNVSQLHELFQYALEAVQCAAHGLSVSSETDPLYTGALAMLESDDRFALIAGYRILARLAANDEGNRLLQGSITGVHVDQALDIVTSAEDNALTLAVLEFLYQYSTYQIGSKALLDRKDAPLMVRAFKDLMLAGHRLCSITLNPSTGKAVEPRLPALPEDTLMELVQFAEPERAARWLCCMFEPVLDEPLDNSDDTNLVTQAQIGEAYTAIFKPFAKDTAEANGDVVARPLLPEAEVIKVIPMVFPNARAGRLPARTRRKGASQAHSQQPGSSPGAMRSSQTEQITPTNTDMFVVYGIRPRRMAGAIRQQEFVPHKWVPMEDGRLQAVPLDEAVTNSDAEEGSTRPIITQVLQQRSTRTNSAIDSQAGLMQVRQLCTPVNSQDGEPVGVALVATKLLRNLAKSKRARVLFASIELDIVRVASVNPAIATHASELIAEAQ